MDEWRFYFIFLRGSRRKF
jgi:hypothetical protein